MNSLYKQSSCSTDDVFETPAWSIKTVVVPLGGENGFVVEGGCDSLSKRLSNTDEGYCGLVVMRRY